MRQSSSLSSAARREWAPVGGSRIAVLAGRDDDNPTGLRSGAVVLPLDRRLAGRVGMVGPEVAIMAGLLDVLRTPPAAVIMVADGVDFDGVVGQVRDVACGLLELEAGDDPLLAVSVTCPAPVRPNSAGDLSLHNLHLEVLPEALVESVAAARRGNQVTVNGHNVLLLQRFAPPTATAVVYARPDRRLPVRIRSRWGLTETGGRPLPFDQFEVAADGRGVRETLAWKPTANVTASGGTRTVDLSARRSYQRSLSRTWALRLARQARAAAAITGGPLTLDVAMFADTSIVVRCRPGAVAMP